MTGSVSGATNNRNHTAVVQEDHTVIKTIGVVAVAAVGGVSFATVARTYFDYKTHTANIQHQVTMADLQYKTEVARLQDANMQRATMADLQSRVKQSEVAPTRSAPFFNLNLSFDFNLFKGKK